MGMDKALLPFDGLPLAVHVARVVKRAAGIAILVGPPEKYGHLGFPVVPDVTAGAGPLAGIQSALLVSPAEWNLIVACDMPRVSEDFLRRLLDAATGDCLVPAGPSGRREPLCAVYHARCLPAIERALAAGVRRVMDALAALETHEYPVEDGTVFANCNTPEEWQHA